MQKPEQAGGPIGHPMRIAPELNEDALRRFRANETISDAEASDLRHCFIHVIMENPRNKEAQAEIRKLYERYPTILRGATDVVNHPAHYTAGGIECIDAIAAATAGLEGIEAACTANAIKYLWRWKRKNGQEDLRKARWYIDHLLGEHDKEKSNAG